MLLISQNNDTSKAMVMFTDGCTLYMKWSEQKQAYCIYANRGDGVGTLMGQYNQADDAKTVMTWIQGGIANGTDAFTFPAASTFESSEDDTTEADETTEDDTDGATPEDDTEDEAEADDSAADTTEESEVVTDDDGETESTD